ncbi:MAG: DUF4366 domain-containing protein [Defluviitaleaceae bacterium]|nr:DUF4366 domain-containing protein [Defluviitaleaceae bacterium]
MIKTYFIATFLMVSMLSMGTFYVQAYVPTAGMSDNTMIVNASWLDGETLRVDVVDSVTGARSALAVRLSDLIGEAEDSPYILVQAVDLDGNQSGVIQLKNPFYVPEAGYYAVDEDASPSEETDHDTQTTAGADDGYSESASDGTRPFTPDGTGTVLDNVTEADGKEFFTIKSEDGNEFFLIVDRQRSFDNVYLLNAVTEEDLMSLAQASGRLVVNDTPAPTEPPSVSEEQESTPIIPQPEPPAQRQSNRGALIFIALVAVAAIGAGYYFKIVKSKKDSFESDGDEDDFDHDEGIDDDFGDEHGEGSGVK